MAIRLTYGTRQTFRYRTQDLTIRGQVEPVDLPVRSAEFRLNGGPSRPFYVEATSDEGVDWVAGYKTSPAELRCRQRGDSCLEIDVGLEGLNAGRNVIELTVLGARGRVAATAPAAGSP